jgi:hypothetical protein
MMQSIVVVLPEPLRPTKQTASAALICSETPRSTWAVPR